MSADYFDPSWFGAKSEHVTLHDAQAEAEARALEHAKSLILPKLELTVSDADGKHLSEKKWRKLYRTVAGL